MIQRLQTTGGAAITFIIWVTCPHPCPGLVFLPLFCPPPGLTNFSSSCLPQSRERNFAASLRDHSRALNALWGAATRDGDKPRYRAYWEFFETLRLLDCMLFFVDCYDKLLWQDAVAKLCKVFRAELAAALWWDRKTEARLSYDKADVDYINSSAMLANSHVCYSYRILGDEQLGHHAMLRKQAYVPAWLLMAPGGNQDSLSSAVPRSWRVPTMHSAGGVCGRNGLPSWYAVPRISELLSSAPKGWVLNVGASDGSCTFWPKNVPLFEEDPANCLVHAGRIGLLMEADGSVFSELHTAFAERGGVALRLGLANPGQVGIEAKQIADRTGLPLDLLKVDVDNCDCCFVEEVLRKLSQEEQPRLIHVEVHALVPPPIIFRPRRFDARLGNTLRELKKSRGAWGHMVHCSLAAFLEILQPRGYELLHLEFHNAVFADARVPKFPSGGHNGGDGQLHGRNAAQSGLAAQIESHWFGGYYCSPLRLLSELELTYQEVFLYDYRLWNDVQQPAEKRIGLIRAYLDRWHIPRSSYRLGIHKYPMKAAVV